MRLRFAAESSTVLTLYNQFIRLYSFAVGQAATWNKKAKAWRDGRKDLFSHLQRNISSTDSVIWVHCSSAGEFEQGKPVIEALKRSYPDKKILVTFFSPSGYGVAQNYPFADVITYLPIDTRKNAELFFEAVHPELVIFVKYEFWYHHLSVAAFHHVPILLISATFRKEQVFFKPYGGFFRQMLRFFRCLFVQDQASIDLLNSIGITNCSISGDTRFDRVAAIAEKMTEIPYINPFIGNKQVIVAGSTWEGDDAILSAYAKQDPHTKFIIAPHEITAAHINKLQQLFPGCVLYSQVQESNALVGAQVLIIDSVGLLSRLYAYATITFVGGGFTKDGIHNSLEAAVWGKPVVFGPNYRKYREAIELIAAGGGYSIATADEFKRLASDLLNNKSHLQASSANAKSYIEKNTGATERIMKAIQEKRLLTS